MNIMQNLDWQLPKKTEKIKKEEQENIWQNKT